jgi:hypothetical protein
MQPLLCPVAALAVTLLFYAWRTYEKTRAARERLLRERVAYMLWVVADPADGRKHTVSFHEIG